MDTWLKAAFAVAALLVVTLVVIALRWLEARRTERRRDADKKDASTREAFNEADRLLRSPDDDLAALAAYVPSMWSPEVCDLLTRLAQLDRQT